MKIQGQDIVNTDDNLVFPLREPYWSAYQKFNWENKEAGFGINIDIVKEAVKNKKKIVAVYKGVSYKISPVTIQNFYKKSKVKPIFYARGNVKLIVVPQSKFLALKKFDEKKYEEKEKKRENIIHNRLF